MNIGIVALMVTVILGIILANIVKFGLKICVYLIVFIVFGVTAWICISQPVMHKPFSVNTIEYLLKINKDGSMTTTKQVTQTVIKGETNE